LEEGAAEVAGLLLDLSGRPGGVFDGDG